MSVEVSVLGGLRLAIEFSVYPADPSVGIFNAGVDEWKIVGIGNRTVRENESTYWLEKRLSKEEKKEIWDACEHALKFAHFDF